MLAGTGQWIIRTRNKISDIVLPKAAQPLPALAAGLEEKYDGISSFVTPRGDFYRVDTNLTVPVVDVDSWKLTIDGDVDKEVSFTFDELTKMNVVEHDITLTCVSNEVGGKLSASARWLGVPLRDVLDRAGVGDKADQILSTAVDGFTISTPLEVALDGRNSILAFGMNGEPLPREHGFPVRLVTPGIYGFVGATKWLEKLTLTTYDAREAYWTKRKWATDAPIKLSSRVDTPRPLSTIDAGQTVIGGVAWAQPAGVAKVEVRLDGGDWQEAKLGPSAGVEYWRQWYLPWKATVRQPPDRRARHRPDRRDPDDHPGDPVPRRLQRHPGSRRHRQPEQFLDPHQSARAPAPNPCHAPNAPHSRTKGTTMNSTTLKRTGLAALALTMSMGMAACGSDDSSSSSSSSAQGEEDRGAPAPPRAASSATVAPRSRRRVTAPSRACPPLRSPPPPAPTRS